MDIFKINPISEEEMEKENKRIYENRKKSLNNFSYWYPKITKDNKFKTPESIVLPISYEWHKWLGCDNYKEEKIKEFQNYLISMIEKTNFNINRKLFIKTNDFSNKFVFNFPKLESIDSIASQFLDVNYGGLIVGLPSATEIVIREYITNKEKVPEIYMGMPLNTEFRAFYDFDEHILIDIFNYWDKETMESNLYGHEKKIYMDYADILESKYRKNKDKLKSIITENLKNNNEFKGIWSIDFMYVNGEYYLIDMATVETSYYRERIQNYIESKNMRLHPYNG